MTKKDFFRILIKLFALFAFIQIVFSLIKIIANSLTSEIQFYLVIVNLVAILGVLILLKFVIAKPDFIINFFKLDKNFDDDKIIIGDFTTKKLLNVGLFVIGIYFIISNISLLISNLFLILENSSTIENPYFKDIWSKQQITVAICNILLGFVLIIYKKTIITYFDK